MGIGIRNALSSPQHDGKDDSKRTMHHAVGLGAGHARRVIPARMSPPILGVGIGGEHCRTS
ncbi:MAG: hypothetical protein MK085_05185 [Phycisphaerales bacterium]|nr:hypothetical protein [Phycisphaerales bacterium]